MSHAKLSPSSAHRWLTCPGSIRMSEGIEDTSSPAAEEGTLAHHLGEQALLKGVTTWDITDDEYPDEMRDYIQGYVSYVLSFEGKLKVEKKVDLTEWIPGGYGTADAIIHDGKTVHIIDLKYGLTPVRVERNTQMMLYALGALKAKTKKVVMHIYQPRGMAQGVAEPYTMKAKELRAWGEEIKPAAQLCLTDDAPLVPDDNACRWCPAAGTCPAQYARLVEVVGDDFDSLPDIDDMTAEELALGVVNKKMLITFLGKMEERLAERLNNGEYIPGVKLVEATTRRRYNDKARDYLVQALGDEAWKEPELIGITQASKLIGKARFEDMGITIKPVGKSIPVPENDRRPAVTPTIADFSDES